MTESESVALPLGDTPSLFGVDSVSNGTSLSVVSITLCSTPFHGAFWGGYLTCCNCNLVNYFDPLFPHEFGDIFSKESWDG